MSSQSLVYAQDDEAEDDAEQAGSARAEAARLQLACCLPAARLLAWLTHPMHRPRLSLVFGDSALRGSEGETICVVLFAHLPQV